MVITMLYKVDIANMVLKSENMIFLDTSCISVDLTLIQLSKLEINAAYLISQRQLQ